MTIIPLQYPWHEEEGGRKEEEDGPIQSSSNMTTQTQVLLTSSSSVPKLQSCHRLYSSSSSNVIKNKKLLNCCRLKLLSKNPKLVSIAPKVTMSSSSSSSSSTEAAAAKPYSVLFVCLGNICRSPAAEGVFRSLVASRGLDSRFVIDSAGTIGYHEGNPADPRMRAASGGRGIDITSISRPIRPSDFRVFDLILAMDKQNRDDILAAYERWSFKESLPENAQRKVKLMCSYCKKHSETEVPDPYYGGPQGFEKVLDLLEDACESLLDGILAENSSLTPSS